MKEKSEIDFQKMDGFSAFLIAFELYKNKLSKKFELSVDEIYDVLFDDYLKNIVNKYNPHQAFCFCKKRFNWILLEYVKKRRTIPFDERHMRYMLDNQVEYGIYKKPKREVKYHTKRLGKPRGYAAGRPKRAVSMFFKNKHIRDFESIAEATKYMKVAHGQIQNSIIRGIKCHGYKFTYCEVQNEV